MNILKALFVTAVLGFSLNGYALDDDSYMELSSALSEGKMKVVKKYMEADPKLVKERFFGWEPLQMAAKEGHLEVVKYLVSKGADKNYIHPVSYMTAFHLAALENHPEVVKYLAKEGADINIKLKADVSIIRAVRDFGSPDMVELLSSLGVKDDGCKEECF
jgi:uncharacterized protein